MTSSRSDCRFSLMEVIASLVVIGVIAAVTASRITDTGADAAAEAARVKAHLRFAQALSMSDDTVTWGIHFTAGSYTLYRSGAPASLSLPGETSSTRNLEGVTLTAGIGTVNFDNLGSPGPVDQTVVLAGTKTILITKNTGHIP